MSIYLHSAITGLDPIQIKPEYYYLIDKIFYGNVDFNKLNSEEKDLVQRLEKMIDLTPGNDQTLLQEEEADGSFIRLEEFKWVYHSDHNKTSFDISKNILYAGDSDIDVIIESWKILDKLLESDECLKAYAVLELVEDFYSFPDFDLNSVSMETVQEMISNKCSPEPASPFLSPPSFSPPSFHR